METQHSTSPRRRRFFKIGALAALATAIAAGVGAGYKAFAQGSWHRGGMAAGPLDPAQVDKRLDHMLRHLYAEIDATAEQKQKLAPIVKEAARDLLPLRERARAGHAQMIE